MIVFTDGPRGELKPWASATVGGVLFDPKKPGHASACGLMVPSELLQHWRSDGKTHVIGLVDPRIRSGLKVLEKATLRWALHAKLLSTQHV